MLSGGGGQRVAIDRAFSGVPRLLLLGEALSSLDSVRGIQLLDYFERVSHKLTFPTIWVTRSLQEIIRLAQDVLVFSNGNIVEQGDMVSLLSRPGSYKHFSGQPFTVLLDKVSVECDQHDLTKIAAI